MSGRGLTGRVRQGPASGMMSEPALRGADEAGPGSPCTYGGSGILECPGQQAPDPRFQIGDRGNVGSRA